MPTRRGPVGATNPDSCRVESSDSVRKYLYCFAYRPPSAEHADEDGEAVFIVADSETEALEWGCRVSERFVVARFDAGDWQRDAFAHWIEHDYEELFAAEGLSKIPVVEVGEYPDWARLLFDKVVAC